MHTWSQRVTVALVYPALPPSLTLLSSSPSSLSCCVSLPTNVSATMGQWLILVCLAKCLQDVCLGCLFPPPCPPPLPACLGVVGREWQAPLLLPSRPLAPAVTAGGGAHHHRGTKATWTDRDLLFWPEPLFSHPPPPPPCAVCLVCAGGVWWEKSWPSTEGL